MLELWFAISLFDPAVQDFERELGPLFYRWMPNGEADAISIPVTEPGNSIKVWFERRGYISDPNLWVYDADKKDDVGSDVFRRQTKVNGGYLFGAAIFAGASPEELEALSKDDKGSAHYVALGKRVIKFLAPPLIAFVETLRVRFGQYWLRELRSWDSRTESLGQYCRMLQLRWRQSPIDEWVNFVPNTPTIELVGRVFSDDTYRRFITEADWRELRTTFQPDLPQPLPLQLLVSVQRLRNDAHDTAALVQAVTTLELAVAGFVRNRRQQSSKAVQDATQNFGEFGTAPARLALVLMVGQLVPASTVDLAVQAIALRNRVAHEGSQVPDDADRYFDAIFECVKALVEVPGAKMPHHNVGAAVTDPP